MKQGFANNSGLSAAARKAVSALHARLLNQKVSLVLVVIILVLLIQSGVGLTA